MKTTRHTSEIRICADDFRGDHAAVRCITAICEIIAKAEGTIKANGCRLVKYSISNEPSRDLNPVGDIVTITFWITSPICLDKVKLDVDYIEGNPGPDELMPCERMEKMITVNLNFIP